MASKNQGFYSWETPPTAVTGHNQLIADGFIKIQSEDLNDEWFRRENLRCLKWGNEKLVLPPNMNTSLCELKGGDIPDFPNGAQYGSQSHPPGIPNRGSVVLHEANTDKDLNFGGNKAPYYGGQVTFRLNMESQIPSIELRYKLLAGERAGKEQFIFYRMQFFGNTSMDKVNYYSPASINQLPCQIPEQHKDGAKENRLFALTLQFGKSEAGRRAHNSIIVQYRKDSDSDGQDRWDDYKKMVQELRQDDTELGEFEKFVKRLHQGKDITLTFFRDFLLIEKPKIAVWEAQHQYWVDIMNLACQHGPFWFYGSQPGFNNDRPGMHFSHWEDADAPPPVPFWLMQSCTVYVKQGVVMKLEPRHWAAVVQDPTSPALRSTKLPHPNLAVFLRELSLVRKVALATRATRILSAGYELELDSFLAPHQCNETAPYTVGSSFTGMPESTRKSSRDMLNTQPQTSLAAYVRAPFSQDSRPDITADPELQLQAPFGRLNVGERGTSDPVPAPGSSHVLAADGIVCFNCWTRGHKNTECWRSNISARERQERKDAYLRQGGKIPRARGSEEGRRRGPGQG